MLLSKKGIFPPALKRFHLSQLPELRSWNRLVMMILKLLDTVWKIKKYHRPCCSQAYHLKINSRYVDRRNVKQMFNPLKKRRKAQVSRGVFHWSGMLKEKEPQAGNRGADLFEAKDEMVASPSFIYRRWLCWQLDLISTLVAGRFFIPVLPCHDNHGYL